MYKILFNGRYRKFATIELAKDFAGKYYTKTGIFLGIENA